jgi:hypothetical protein
MSCRGDVAIVDDGVMDLAEKVKEITDGYMAYGAIDAVAGEMTGGKCIKPSLQCFIVIPFPAPSLA